MTAAASLPSRRIVVAGGGTAGWMTANLLAHRWPGMDICLVEAPEIGTIGVGEGSTPSLRRFFEVLGIAERDWMPRCHATYKTNIRFAGWSPQGPAAYSHPFTTQLDHHTIPAFFANARNRRLGYDVRTAPRAFLLNAVLADEARAPLAPAHFPFRIDYGYHFDSAALGAFLRETAMARGVVHHAARILEVQCSGDGQVTGLLTDRAGTIGGDLFVDCTGFAGMLLQQALGVGFVPFAENLFNDAAVVLPVPRAAHAAPGVETVSTALPHGWMWSIPLTSRTGHGYVYARTHASPDVAETELRTRLGLLDSAVEARHLTMKVGRVAHTWQGNVVAVGLAQGFIEPLEATALHLVLNTVEQFMKSYEAGGFTAQHAAGFNDHVATLVERVRDYIVAHYKLNTRSDTDYWIACRDSDALSLPLRRILDVWYRREDLAAELAGDPSLSHFSVESWHCLLAGYGVFPGLRADQRGPDGGEVDFHVAHGVARFLAGCASNFPLQADVLAQAQAAA